MTNRPDYRLATAVLSLIVVVAASQNRPPPWYAVALAIFWSLVIALDWVSARYDNEANR